MLTDRTIAWRPAATTAGVGPWALRHRVDDKIDRELRVVLGPEPLVLPVVVPLAAVVLVRVDDAEPAAALDAAQVGVHDVVAPAVELMAGLRRAVGELEKGAVEPVGAGN